MIWLTFLRVLLQAIACTLCSHTHPADSKLRMGDNPTRMKKCPRDSDRHTDFCGELSTGYPGTVHRTKHRFHFWNLHTVSSYSVATNLATLRNLFLLAWPAFQRDQGLPSVHSSLQRRCSRLCTPGAPDLEYCTTCFSTYPAWWA